MAMVEDLVPFFNAAEFATAATLGGVPVLGIFDRAYAEASLGYTAAATSRPSYTLPTAQALNAEGATLVVSGVGSFVVAEVQPDGTGLTLLMLERA